MLDPRFIELESGRVFCITHVPQDESSRERVIVLPAFGDEMNKTRATLTKIGQVLSANHGIGLTIPDLFGTGDSDGEFVSASWKIWNANVVELVNWLESQGCSIVGCVTIRTGSLLFQSSKALWATHRAPVTALQPVWDGTHFIKQFLRIRVMSELAQGNTESVDDLMTHLLAGKLLNVSGYEIGLQHVEGMMESVDFSTYPFNVEVVETTRVKEKVGVKVDGRVTKRTLEGEAYWGSTETIVDSNVVDAVVASITGRH